MTYVVTTAAATMLRRRRGTAVPHPTLMAIGGALCYRHLSSSASSGSRSGAPSDASLMDSTDAFLQNQVRRAVDKNRISAASANYLQSMLATMPHMKEAVAVAQQHIGDQDPERFTQFQQQQFVDRLSLKCSELTATTISKGIKEQEALRNFGQSGEATGENYWVEAGSTLTSFDVPQVVKDDIVDHMQRDRSAKKAPENQDLGS